MITKHKVISLWQPWASLVVEGVKTIETRGWSTKHRGPLLIHAAKRAGDCPFLADFAPEIASRELTRGAIIGMCEIEDVIRTEELSRNVWPDQNWCSDFRPGRFAWLLKNPMLFKKPLFIKGRQNFFSVEINLEDHI